MKIRKIKVWYDVNKPANKNELEKYKDRLNDYFVAYVFNDFKEFRRYVKKYAFEDYDASFNAGAMCKYDTFEYYDELGNLVDMDNNCGKIMFIKDRYGSKVISHEVVHAVNKYFKHRIEEKDEIYDNPDMDELFAYMVGGMTAQIVDKCFYGIKYDKKVDN